MRWQRKWLLRFKRLIKLCGKITVVELCGEVKVIEQFGGV